MMANNNDNAKRLETAVVSYLRGVRNELQFFEQITKPLAEGGLGLSPDKATAVKKQIDNFQERMLAAGKSMEEVVNEYLGKGSPQPKKQNEPASSGNLSAAPIEDVEIDVPTPPQGIPHRPQVQIEKRPLKTVTKLRAESQHKVVEPLDQHIAGHQKAITQLKELGASSDTKNLQLANHKDQAPEAKPPVEFILNPEPKKKEPAITITVPLNTKNTQPAVVPVVAAPIKNAPSSEDIKEVQKRPVIQRVEKKEVPAQIARQIEAEAVPPYQFQKPAPPAPAAVQNPLPQTQVVAVPEKKPGLFKRLFGGGKKSSARSQIPPNQQFTMVPAGQVPGITPAPAPAPTYQRPKLEDVAFVPKLFSPIDELGSLGVADFRRLAKEPQQAAQKIIDKIDLLAQESMQKRTDGIVALKSSPLYKAYSQIMSTSILEGKSFADAIAGQESLSSAEFYAIMELNRKLKM